MAIHTKGKKQKGKSAGEREFEKAKRRFIILETKGLYKTHPTAWGLKNVGVGNRSLILGVFF